MAHCLQASCEDSIADTYVAVVGYAHVHGIAEKFPAADTTDLQTLESTFCMQRNERGEYPVLKIDRTCL